MNVVQVLSDLARRQIHLWLDDGRLRFKAPKGALTPDLKQVLKANKPAIIEWLAERDAVLRGERSDLPVSPLQAGLVLDWRMDPKSYHANIASIAELRPGLDLDLLRRAAGEILRRHLVLRTVFPDDPGGRVVGRLDPDPALAFAVTDGRGWSTERVRRWQDAEMDRPFDLRAGPIMRLAILEHDAGGPARRTLLWTVHHVATDYFTQEMLQRQLDTFYRALEAGEPLPGPPEGHLSHHDFVRWQQDLLAERGERLADWWRETLDDVPDMQWPTRMSPVAADAMIGSSFEFELDPALIGPIRAVARQNRTTTPPVLLAVWQLLVARYTGMGRFWTLGSTSLRDLPGFGATAGYISDPAPIVSAPGDHETVGELVRDVSARWNAVLDHRHHPFPELVRELLGRTGLDVLHQLPDFVYLDRRDKTPTDGIYRAIRNMQRGAQQALALVIFDEGDRMGARFVYRTDAFEQATIARMAAHLRTLLANVVTHPDARLDDLEMLPPAERHRLLVEWNDTAEPYPSEAPIHRLVEANAARHPDEVALIYDEDDGSPHRTMTYGELDGRASRLARGLLTLGVTPGQRVAVYFDRSFDLVVAEYAVLKAGCTYVPLDTRDPQVRVGHMLEDTTPSVLLTVERLRGQLPAADARVVTLDGDPFADLPAGPLDVEVDAGLAFYVGFTSGSTGRPKGALLPHRGMVRLALDTGDYAIRADDTLFFHSAITFDVAAFEVWTSLINGARLFIPRPGPLLPQAIGRLVERHDVSVLWLTAGLFHLVIDEMPTGLEGLRVLLAGGDVLSPDHINRAVRALPKTRMVACYGPTENNTYTTSYAVLEELPPGATTPLGKPIDNTRVYILDPARRPTPVGVIGEVYCAGDGVGHCYLNREALSAERFLSSMPSVGEEGPLYRTGDHARWLPSGDIEFIGRVDDQIKIRGYRIELTEIESALQKHPAVRDGRVIAPTGPDGGRRVLAFYVAEDGAGDDGRPTAIRDHLEGALPDYMMPSRITPLDELPLNSRGKVDRHALAEMAATAMAESGGGAAPRTPTEALLSGIWTAVLDQPVSRDTHFFRAGGHSLLAARALARVQSRTGVEMPLRAAFENPTLSGLAAALDRAAPGTIGAPAPIAQVPRDGELPLLPTQSRLWFLDRLGLPAGVYTIPLLLRLRGALDTAKLDAALGALVARHESLRTVFPDVDGRPAPRIVAADRAGFTLERARGDAETLFAGAIERDFDLAAGPLFRATLARQGDDDHLLLLAWHHIIADGLSVDRLVVELGALYAGETLPPPVQCVDYAAWRAARTDEAALAPHLDGWQRALDGAPAVHRLPTDRPRPPVQRFVGGHHLFELPATLLEPLRRLAAEHDATLYMTLLAAFEVLLSRSGAGEDVVIGTPVAGRDHPDAASTVGLLVDMLPLRCAVDGDAPFTALLAATRETLLDAHRHQAAPFERIVDRLRPARDPGHTPIFQIVFDVPHDPVVDIPGLDATVVRDFEAPISKFDLTLSLMPGCDRFEGRIEYASDLFDRATIAAMARRLQTLLEGIVADPEQPVRSLPVMTAAERRRVLVEWNDTASGYDRAATVPGLFAARVAARPDAVALVIDDGEAIETVDYAALDARARAVARALARAGVGRGDRVGLYAERGFDAIAGMLGALIRGAAYVPLDPSHPPARLGFMLDDTRPTAVLVSPDNADRMPSGPWATLALDTIDDFDASDNLDDFDGMGDDAADAIMATDAAYVLYTSGTTGRPKGVEVSHRNIVRLVARPNFATFGPDDTFLQAAPLGFDAATLELWGCLLNGGRLVVPAAGQLALDRIAALISQHRVSTLWLTAGLFDVMVDDDIEALRPLRQLLVGGDVLSPGHVRRAVAALPDGQLINGYGPTENTTFTCCQVIDGSTRLEPSVPIGRPIADTQVYILDEARRPVPVGVPGELYAGGDGVARGYLNRPELTAERFVTVDLPEVGPTRLYRTGDRARWLADGTVEFRGRLDEQVKIRGFRIEPGEIEAALARHPAVTAARVVPRPGPDGRRLVAYVVPPDAPVDGLRRHLGDLLPAHMLPAAFVPLEALPLTVNGKLDRAALPDPEGAPTAAAPPRSALAARIAAIWQAVLGVAAVDVERSFFDVGGSSLTLLQVHSRLQAELGRALPITDLFRYPTVAGLAGRLDGPAEPDGGTREAEARAARRRARLGRRPRRNG